MEHTNVFAVILRTCGSLNCLHCKTNHNLFCWPFSFAHFFVFWPLLLLPFHPIHLREQQAICSNLEISFWRQQFLRWEAKREGKKRRVKKSDRRKYRGQNWAEILRKNERWQGNFIALTCMPSVKWIKCFWRLIHSCTVSLSHPGFYVTLKDMEGEANITEAVKVLSSSFHCLGSTWMPVSLFRHINADW